MSLAAMNKLSLSTAFLFVCLLSFAGPVSQNEAQERARQFLSSRHASSKAKHLRLAKRQQRQQSLRAVEAADAASYYVFNIDGNGGFVIVSGDDRSPAILGYSDDGNFDADNIPPSMASWLESCEEFAAALADISGSESGSVINDFATPSGQSVAKAPKVRNSIAPLIATAWNQNVDPYNRLLLDTVRYSARCATGCVATAMAQLLNYHAQLTGKPEATTGDIAAYITMKEGYYVDGAAKGTTIDWANMQNSYSMLANEESNNAVALLMHLCGASVATDYTAESSSANDFLVPDALKGIFGYDAATRIVERKDYTISQWNDLIYAELTEHRPVFYFGTSSGGGHAFLVDGFDGDEMYHVNWGWGGHCDGYYLLTLANPTDKQGAGAGSAIDGYSMSQGAIIGAQPDTGKPFVEENLQLTLTDVALEGNIVKVILFNFNETAAEFQYGIGYFGDDDSLVPLNTFDTSSIEKNKGIKNGIIISSLPKTDGTVYKLAVISRKKGTDKWLTNMNPDDYYIEAASNNGKVALELKKPVPQLKVESIACEPAWLAKRSSKVDVTVSNSGKEFYGDIYFISRRIGQTLSETLSQGATILEGQSQTVQYLFKPVYAGKYEVTIAAKEEETQGLPRFSSEDRTVVFYQDTIEVAEGTPVSNSVNLDIDIKIANLDRTGTSILGEKAQVAVTVKNDTDTDFEGEFVILMFDVSYKEISYYPVIRQFEAHSETVLEEEFGVTQGKRYLPMVITDPNYRQVTQAPRKTYGVMPAVTLYFADGTRQAKDPDEEVVVPDDAVGADFFGNSTTTSVIPSGNPNCLYYFSEGQDKPAGLMSNVVIGSNADVLTISDQGLPFMPISAFTADTVMYTRHFTEGVKAITDSMGTAVKPSWTTICLPFEADRCIVDGEVAVDWMRHEEDSVYNFWLMEFEGDERNTLFFSPADTMKAYTPYLIAVPGAGLKGLRDMTAKPVMFCGRNAALTTSTKGIAASSNYKLVGSMENVSEAGWVYNIDADGTGWRRGNVALQPFRAYLKAMSNSTHTEYVPVSMAAMLNVEAEESKWTKGDVNGDSSVNVADISAVITVMAGDGPQEWVVPADVNGDGAVNVADISAIITIMAE